jgi:hypothetical protein
MSFLSTSNQSRISKGQLALAGSFEYANTIDAGIKDVANGAVIEFMGVRQSQ